MLNINDQNLNYLDIQYNPHNAEETKLSYFLEYPHYQILKRLPNHIKEVILDKNQLYLVNAFTDISEVHYAHYDLFHIVRLKDEHIRLLENLNIYNYTITFEKPVWDKLYVSFAEYIESEYSENFINDTVKENCIKFEELWTFSYFDNNFDFNMFVSYNLDSLLEYIEKNIN
jgi:hypothetical protein